MNLEELRKALDRIDGKILKLLSERATISKEIKKYKEEKKIPVFDPKREEEVVNRILLKNKGLLKEKQLRIIYKEILSACRSLQEPLTIAYLGPEATFTHQAAMYKFGSSSMYLPTKSIEEVFREVERGKANFGVVPVENSTEGVETHTLDTLVESELLICDEVILKITHNLFSFSPLKEIRRVYSHPQALAQCKGWIGENLSHAEVREVYSTARAVEEALSDRKGAAIASSLAGEIYNIPVVTTSIEDKAFNYTRFFVIGKERRERTGKDKTSIIFGLKDEVGALFHVLEIFWRFDINMTKIESRPSRRKAWEYYFFVDIEGHQEDKKVKEALEELKKKVTFIKILGSYPKRKEE